MAGITLEGLILTRLNDVHNAMLTNNYPLALNALQIIWTLIPDEDLRKQIEEKTKSYQEEWKERSESLMRLFNEREYDEQTRRMRLQQEGEEHTLRMITEMAEFTTRLLIDNNLISREPSVP